MKKTRWIVPGMAALLAVGSIGFAQDYGDRNGTTTYAPTRIVTELTGDQVVGSVATDAIGKVYFDVRRDGSLHYRVSARNIEDVTGVYVHLGKNRQTGPVIATLYAPAQPVDHERGTLVEGDLTSENLVGRFQETGVSYVVDQLMNNNAYIVITTEDNPQGEIRGNIPYPYN